MRATAAVVLSFVFVLLLLSSAQPAQEFSLEAYEIRLVFLGPGRGITTNETLAWTSRSKTARPVNFSHGYLPIGRLVMNGKEQELIKPNRGGRLFTRCELGINHVRVGIGYKLDPALYTQIATAGPCLTLEDGRVDIRAWEEGFRPSFIYGEAARGLLCTDRLEEKREWGRFVLFHFYGNLDEANPLTQRALAEKMKQYDVEVCINTDGGQQLDPNVRNTVVLVVVAKVSQTQAIRP